MDDLRAAALVLNDMDVLDVSPVFSMDVKLKNEAVEHLDASSWNRF